MKNQIASFFEIMEIIAEGKELPISEETWTRAPFTRKQFNELFCITPSQSRDEIAKRIRAISYGPYQPYVEIDATGSNTNRIRNEIRTKKHPLNCRSFRSASPRSG